MQVLKFKPGIFLQDEGVDVALWLELRRVSGSFFHSFFLSLQSLEVDSELLYQLVTILN